MKKNFNIRYKLLGKKGETTEKGEGGEGRKREVRKKEECISKCCQNSR